MDSQGQNKDFPVEPSARSNTLIVRECDRHFWTMYEKGVMNNVDLDGIAHKNMLIVGPEGVGKVIIY